MTPTWKRMEKTNTDVRLRRDCRRRWSHARERFDCRPPVGCWDWDWTWNLDTKDGRKKWKNVQPRCSMYGIFTYIYPKNGPNVGKYSIHGAFGQWFSLFSGWCWLTQNHLEDENDQRIQDGWKFASDKWVKWDWTAQEQQLHSESLGESSPCPTLLCLSLNVVPFLLRKKWKTMEKG